MKIALFLFVTLYSCTAFNDKIAIHLSRDLNEDINATHAALDEFVVVFWNWYFEVLNFSVDLKSVIKDEMEQVKTNLAALDISENELIEMNRKIDTAITESEEQFSTLLRTFTEYIVIESRIRQDLDSNLNNLPWTYEFFTNTTIVLNEFWDETSTNLYVTIPQSVKDDLFVLIEGMTGTEVDNIRDLIETVSGRYSTSYNAAQESKILWDAEANKLDAALVVVLGQIPSEPK